MANRKNPSDRNDSEIPRDQALAWFVKMRSDKIAPELVEQFEIWLRAHPSHKLEYEKLCSLWSDLDEVSDVAKSNLIDDTGSLPKRGRSKNRPLFFPKVRMARALGVVSFLVVLLFLVPLDDFLLIFTSDYQTAIGEQKKISLEDGSTVFLNTNSAISVEYTSLSRRIRLQKGQAYFHPQKDPKRPFSVEADAVTAVAIGTEFEVLLKSSQVAVTLFEGSLQVSGTPQKKESHTLKPGDRVVYTEDSKEGVFEVVDSHQARAWQRGKLIFQDMPLHKVVDQVSRYRHGKIFIVDSKLRNLSVSGVFDIDQPQKMLDVIEKTLPVETIDLTSYLILLKSRQE